MWALRETPDRLIPKLQVQSPKPSALHRCRRPSVECGHPGLPRLVLRPLGSFWKPRWSGTQSTRQARDPKIDEIPKLPTFMSQSKAECWNHGRICDINIDIYMTRCSATSVYIYIIHLHAYIHGCKHTCIWTEHKNETDLEGGLCRMPH